MEIEGKNGAKETLLVTKSRVQWKRYAFVQVSRFLTKLKPVCRELLRAELPELKRQELKEVSKAADGMDLLKMLDQKEERMAKVLHLLSFSEFFFSRAVACPGLGSRSSAMTPSDITVL
jgi:hypothetical protein